MSFKLIAKSGAARAGEIVTSHGVIPTPAFMPVGSQATVKSLAPDDLAAIGARMVLANTYHLYLRPGIETIERLGGLHRFMAWQGAILTDSGGFQVFSLSQLRRINDEGVTFRSHIDGSEHFFSPELAIKYEEALGADIVMAFDECPAYGESEAKVGEAVERTARWAERCRKAHNRQGQELYGIVQGGVFPALRKRSAEQIVSLDFDGYAVGGLSIGEPKNEMLSTLEATVPLLPEDKTRYMMGVGSPEDIVEAVGRGIDIFDCALPTRTARNGALLTWEGRRNIYNAAFAQQEAPVMAGCRCYACRNFSAAYLHHLFKARELLAYRLATLHNLTFMQDLVTRLRESIFAGQFEEFRKEFWSRYQPTDEEVRITQKQKWLEAKKRESA